MMDWLNGLMGGQSQGQGQMPSMSGMTGTPDGVGPVQGGIDQGFLGDLTDEQLDGLIRQQMDPMAAYGMKAGLGQGQPQPSQQQQPGAQADSMQSLMQMAMQKEPQQPKGGRSQMNEYIMGLMKRGM